MDIEALRAEFQQRYELSDTDIIDVLCAWALVNRERAVPIFLLLVGAPSSLKTVLATHFGELKDAYIIGSLTEKAFISGLTMGKKGNASLLPQLTRAGKILLVNKEFGAIYSMRQDRREDILNQLREIYDGKLSRNFGTGERILWEDFLGFLGCSVPVMDERQLTMAKLGDRFLFWRVRDEDPTRAIEAGAPSIWEGTRPQQSLVAAIESTLTGALKPRSIKVSFSARRALQESAEFLAKIRGQVAWGNNGWAADEILGTVVERPIRLFNAMYAMACGLAALDNQGEVGNSELDIIARIARDTAPLLRLRVYDAVVEQKGLQATIQKRVGLSRRITNRRLRELEQVGLLEKDDDDVWAVV